MTDPDLISTDDLLRQLFSRFDAAVFAAERVEEANEPTATILYSGSASQCHGIIMRADRRIAKMIDEAEEEVA